MYAANLSVRQPKVYRIFKTLFIETSYFLCWKLFHPFTQTHKYPVAGLKVAQLTGDVLVAKQALLLEGFLELAGGQPLHLDNPLTPLGVAFRVARPIRSLQRGLEQP